MGHKRFITEKIVSQTKEDYEFLLKKVDEKNAKIWVNTARVYHNSYQRLKKILDNCKPLFISVNNGNEGLGCTGIHWINLLSYFCDDYEIKLNGDALYDKILSNKRGTDLVEFAGIITATTKHGSTLTINFAPHDNLSFTILN